MAGRHKEDQERSRRDGEIESRWMNSRSLCPGVFVQSYSRFAGYSISRVAVSVRVEQTFRSAVKLDLIVALVFQVRI